MTHVLIFGGSGFIGRNIANFLIKQDGTNVTVFDNNLRKYKDTELDPRIRFVEGDVTQKSDFSNVFDGIDTVFNLAYLNGTSNFYTRPAEILKIAGLGQLNLIEAMNASPTVKRFVYFSSSEAYVGTTCIPTPESVPLTVIDPENPRFSYGGGKIFGELTTHHCVASHIEKYIIRPHNIFGPNMGNEHVIPQLTEKILRRSCSEVEIEGDGSTTRSFCFIDDFTIALCSYVLRTSGGVFNIGGQVETSISELFQEIAEILGAHVTAVGTTLPEGSVARRCPDIRKLRDTGYIERVGFHTGLRRTVVWYRDLYVKR